VRRNNARRMPNSALDESGVTVSLVTSRNHGRLSISYLAVPLTKNIGLRGNFKTKGIRIRTRVYSNPGKSRLR